MLPNQDATAVASTIAKAITPLLLATVDSATPQKLDQACKIFEGLQHGTIDHSLFTNNANSYFNEQALKDFVVSPAPLGTPQEFNQVEQALRGGPTLRVYQIKFAKKKPPPGPTKCPTANWSSTKKRKQAETP